jgi:glutamate dehydrogenase/leucine dehydrogenase
MQIEEARRLVEEATGFADELGPAAVVILRNAVTGVEAIVVLDNVAAGPAIGGVRMMPDVSVEEVARLARAMTLKNAAARLPHGGGKAGIVADPSMSPSDKEAAVRWFARSIRGLDQYIPGPDMGTDETCMAWVYDEIGRCVGLPSVLGGIPLDELGATGFGLAVAADAVEAAGLIELDGARVAIQGFGAVGRNAARFLAERGAVLVSISNRAGSVTNSNGLDISELDAWQSNGKSVGSFAGGESGTPEAPLWADCDILVPAARGDVITATTVGRVRARLVLEGANLPITTQAEATLHDRGVLCIPDWIANAGGVICGSVEYRGGSRAEAFSLIDETIRENTAAIVERSLKESIPPRRAAEELATSRVEKAMRLRRS